jgi:SAM-dependent methyltransferase
MSSLIQWLDSKLYPSFGRNWDDQLFREVVLSCIAPADRMLDLGAGAGIVPQMNFRGLVARVCGVDLDPRVRTNPFLDEGQVGGGEHLPYANETFDIVIADNVVEHLADPFAVFSEIARVLKPGGVFIFKTPNKLHYMPTIAKITPHWFHRFYNRLRGRAATDTFPTCYRANTPASVEKIGRLSGLVLNSIQLVEGRPEYLRGMALTYLLGWAYERAVNHIRILEQFRILLIATLRKPLN